MHLIHNFMSIVRLKANATIGGERRIEGDRIKSQSEGLDVVVHGIVHTTVTILHWEMRYLAQCKVLRTACRSPLFRFFRQDHYQMDPAARQLLPSSDEFDTQDPQQTGPQRHGGTLLPS